VPALGPLPEGRCERARGTRGGHLRPTRHRRRDSALNALNSERPWKGISFLVLDKADVVVGRDDRVRVPYRLPDGTVFRERFFARDGRVWWGPGDRLIPFGLETLPPPDKAARSALIICEGESDTLAVREAFAATPPGNPIEAFYAIGLPGARAWRPQWASLVDAFNVIYLLGDGDNAGRQMVDAVHRNLPWSRPVWLPEGTDARSILQTHGPRALDPYLDRADEVAKLCVAFMTATTYEEFVQLMSGRAVRRAAA
jgi:hypothetical protein